MSLDQNLFTLNFVARTDNPKVIELTDPLGTIHYRKEPTESQASLYEFTLIDPLSESALATVTAPSASSKLKTIELHNPSVPVELKYTGTFTFRWTFRWGGHEFEWKREECFLIRKPDPPVMVAITKEPPGKIKTQAVQILDYNLGRFDIDDRKGLDIVLLSSLLTFQDYNDAVRNGAKREDSSSSIPSQERSEAPAKSRIASDSTPPPALPPKPKKSGPERIAEMQRGDLHDVVVATEEDVEAYAEYCGNLLQGDNMLFITLRSSTAETVPKVLQVLHETKRIRHKSGSEDELHQYVRYDSEQNSNGKKGPRIIKLDDDASSGYKPPQSLIVYLSKIPMPELEPKKPGKAQSSNKEPTTPPRDSPVDKKAHERELKRIEKEEEKQRREREKLLKKAKGKDKGKNDGRAHSLDRDRNRAEPSRPSPDAAHRVHPHQSSSSLYTSPAPRAPNSNTFLSSARDYTPTGLRPPTSDRPARPVSMHGSMPGYAPPPAQQPVNTPNGLFDRLRRW